MTTPAETAAGQQDGPLAGVRVLDLSGYIAGPYGCTLLADQGAEVIKIEPPEGDNLRKYPSTLAAEGRAFLGVNRGKLGIVAGPEAAATAARCCCGWCARPTCWCTTSAPPCRRGWASTTRQLREVNPRLVYCAVTGYGEHRPAEGQGRLRPGAAGDDRHLRDAGPRRASRRSSTARSSTTTRRRCWPAACRRRCTERERSGQGQHVGVSLMRSALAMQSARLVWARRRRPRRRTATCARAASPALHPTREGSLYLSANTPHFWKALCELIGLPELAADERYDTVRKRVAACRRDRAADPRAALQARSALEWEELFGERVPCAAVRQIEDMFDHPQVAAEGMVQDFEHPLVGRYRGFSRSIAFGEGQPAPALPAPVFGQHSARDPGPPWLQRR